MDNRPTRNFEIPETPRNVALAAGAVHVGGKICIEVQIGTNRSHLTPVEAQKLAAVITEALKETK